MISVLVLGFETASGRQPTVGDSVRTLTALVPGAVDGVIRDVTLLATSPGLELGKVAEHAGCGFLAGASGSDLFGQGVALTRSEHVLVLPAGVSFDRALSDEIAARVSRWGMAGPGGIRVLAEAGGLLARLVPSLAPTVGLLTTRQRLRRVRPAGFAALLRGLRPLGTFRSRAWSGRT